MIDSELWLGEHVTTSPWAKLLQEELKALKQEVRVQKTAVEAYKEAYLKRLEAESQKIGQTAKLHAEITREQRHIIDEGLDAVIEDIEGESAGAVN